MSQKKINDTKKLSWGRTKPVVSAEYVVGITDGEGCFYVNVSKMPTYKTGYRIQLHFHIKLQEADRALLEKIQNTLGCGGVYFQKETRSNHASCYRYTVGSQKDIFETIIPFFQQHELQTSTKRNSFELFCRIAELIRSGKHLDADGVRQIMKLKSEMNKRTAGLA